MTKEEAREFKHQLSTIIAALEDSHEKIAQAVNWFAEQATMVDSEKSADLMEDASSTLSGIGADLDEVLSSLDGIE